MPKVIAALALLLALAACTHDQPAPVPSPGHACEDTAEYADTYAWLGGLIAEDKANLARIPASDQPEQQNTIDGEKAAQFHMKQNWDAAKEACAHEKGSK